jgi:1-acyl-sn-glycerol-3-phosphate acyltransferase
VTLAAVLSTLLVLALFRRDAIYAAAQRGCRWILRAAGARVRVEGEFPSDGTYIVMSNHESFADLFVLPSILRGRFTAVMAEEMMRYPLLQPVLRRLRIVPIVREDQERAIGALKIAEDALHEGYHVVILPEGTRTTDGRMLPFKSGGFYMAMQARAPILPVGISGGFQFKPKNRWTLDPGPITVRIGGPIPPEEYEALGTAGLKERTRAEIAALIGEQAGA